jgi:hypothetical protein
MIARAPTKMAISVARTFPGCMALKPTTQAYPLPAGYSSCIPSRSLNV